MELLRVALLVTALLALLAPAAGYERARRAGRRRGSNGSSFSRAPPPGAGPGPELEPEPEPEPGPGPEPEPELEPELEAAPVHPTSNSSALTRSRRVKRQLVIPNGLTVGVIPRFDYTVFTDPTGEREYGRGGAAHPLRLTATPTTARVHRDTRREFAAGSSRGW